MLLAAAIDTNTNKQMMTKFFGKFWLPVDFYFSISRTRKRTLHVPLKVVNLGAESRGIQQRALILEVQSFLHLIVIVDIQRTPRPYNDNHAYTPSNEGWLAPIPSRQPTNPSKSNRHAPHNCHAAGHQPNRAGN